MNSPDAHTAMANGAAYPPATFLHNGVTSHIYRRLLVGAFKFTTPNPGIELNPDFTSMLQYATQCTAAMIVNAQADYVIKNMKKLFRDNGMGGIELRW